VRREKKVVMAEKRTTRRETPRDVEAKTDGKVRRPPEIVHAKTVVVAASRDVVIALAALVCFPAVGN
jgi:hypothetical protein